MANEHLRHFQNRSEAELFELVPTPVWFFDVRNYRFWWCNKAALKMWGVDSVQDMIDKDLSGDSDGAKRRVWQTFEAAAAQGEREETWTTYPNDKPKVTHMRHRSIRLGAEAVEGIIAFVSDDVDLGSMPDTIMLIEAMRYIPNPITVYSMDGHLMRQNEAAGAIYGYPSKEGSQDLDPLFVRRFADQEEGRERLDRATNHEAGREEFQVITRNGPRRHALDVRIGRDPMTGEFNLVVTEEDVTDLRVALEAAEAANRAKSEFLAVMSHELRTPLNGILGFSDTLLEENPGPDQQVMLRYIRESGLGLLDLLNDILDLSKVEAGAMELDPVSFDLRALMERVAGFWRPTVNAKGIDFSLILPDRLPPVLSGDTLRLRQILNNLLSNALKFTEIGGISLRADYGSASGRQHQVTFTVEDSGIGIPAKDQSGLFNPFAQGDGSTARRYGGSGLGLAICKKLVDLMAGEISLRSKPGEGTAVSVSLTLPPGDAAKAEKDSWQQTPVSGDVLNAEGPPVRVLVAEDNHVNQRLLQAYMGRMNVTLDFADDGGIAVEKVQAEDYDLILMDSQMPRMDGVSATREIRSIPGDKGRVPIIALTANAMKGDRERYLAAGMDDHVTKPVERNHLFQAMARCLARDRG